MGYLSKKVLLTAYQNIAGMDSKKQQGLTIKVSMLRYCLAFDMFYKNNGSNLDFSNSVQKKEFEKNVGTVVVLNKDDRDYTINFYNKTAKDKDYGIGSKFTSAGGLRNSKLAPASTVKIPNDANSLMTAKNFTLIRDISHYSHISTGYLTTKELKVAFLLWICRFHDIDDSASMYDGIKAYLDSIFTADLVSQLIISKGDFDNIYASDYNDALITTVSKITASDIASLYPAATPTPKKGSASSNTFYQTIFFGTPGAGKSHHVKEVIENEIEAGEKVQVVRTVFHPDSDYASFVGSYKPVMEKTPFVAYDGTTPGAEVEKITYRYVAQPFMQAYKLAWENPETKVFLVIEEINRGNCAQIFGDIFQLLDRSEGYSEYPISANSDMVEYLSQIKATDAGKERVKAIVSKMDSEGIYFEGASASSTPEELFSKFLCLPENLNILATMNTSDQSLFPMDSAFKRRWDMEYVDIHYAGSGEISDDFKFEVKGDKYSWIEFLYIINEKIYEVTKSEDKQMGNFFIKDSEISEEKFKSKVMFYLWDEVCKDLAGTKHNFFTIKVDGVAEHFTFNDLYKKEKTLKTTGKKLSGGDILELFIKGLGLKSDKEKAAEKAAKEAAAAAALAGASGTPDQQTPAGA